MGIYPQKQICFVYKWTQLSTNKWYIGSRTAKNCNPDDGYLCSSKIVKPLILENPHDWVRVILETGIAKDMLHLEHELLICLGAAKSEHSYNRTNGGKFSNTGNTASLETRIKMSEGNTGKIVSELTKLSMRKPKSSEHRINMSNAAKIRHKNKIECPYCDKIGSIAMMKRWHYDNCKFRYDYHRMH